MACRLCTSWYWPHQEQLHGLSVVWVWHDQIDVIGEQAVRAVPAQWPFLEETDLWVLWPDDWGWRDLAYSRIQDQLRSGQLDFGIAVGDEDGAGPPDLDGFGNVIHVNDVGCGITPFWIRTKWIIKTFEPVRKFRNYENSELLECLTLDLSLDLQKKSHLRQEEVSLHNKLLLKCGPINMNLCIEIKILIRLHGS